MTDTDLDRIASYPTDPASCHPEASEVVLLNPEERDALVAEARAARRLREALSRVVYRECRGLDHRAGEGHRHDQLCPVEALVERALRHP